MPFIHGSDIQIEWHDLHDAVLESVLVEWGEHARVTLTLKPSLAYIGDGKTLRWRFDRLQQLNLPQRNPWGQSELVNGVECRAIETSLIEARIEMQSGDVIEIRAGGFEFRSEA